MPSSLGSSCLTYWHIGKPFQLVFCGAGYGLTKHLTFVQTPRINESLQLIDDCSADIMVLTETWLSSKVCDAELLHCKNIYKFYRCFTGLTEQQRQVVVFSSQYPINLINFTLNIIPTVPPLELVCSRIRFGYQGVVFVCLLPSTSLLLKRLQELA